MNSNIPSYNDFFTLAHLIWMFKSCSTNFFNCCVKFATSCFENFPRWWFSLEDSKANAIISLYSQTIARHGEITEFARDIMISQFDLDISQVNSLAELIYGVSEEDLKNIHETKINIEALETLPLWLQSLDDAQSERIIALIKHGGGITDAVERDMLAKFF